jgi:hypothetical protein
MPDLTEADYMVYFRLEFTRAGSVCRRRKL